MKDKQNKFQPCSCNCRGGVNIGKADVFEVASVHMADDFSTNATTSDTDVTDRYELDTGQRDNFYDIGRLKLKPGKSYLQEDY